MVRNGRFPLWQQCSHRANGVLQDRAILSIMVSGLTLSINALACKSFDYFSYILIFPRKSSN